MQQSPPLSGASRRLVSSRLASTTLQFLERASRSKKNDDRDSTWNKAGVNVGTMSSYSRVSHNRDPASMRLNSHGKLGRSYAPRCATVPSFNAVAHTLDDLQIRARNTVKRPAITAITFCGARRDFLRIISKIQRKRIHLKNDTDFVVPRLLVNRSCRSFNALWRLSSTDRSITTDDRLHKICKRRVFAAVIFWTWINWLDVSNSDFLTVSRIKFYNPFLYINSIFIV